MADLDSLKKQAIELMAQSVGQEQEYDRLEAEADQLRLQLAEVQFGCGQVRDSAAVLRLRAGGAFREIREALLPSKGGWTAWLGEIKQSHGWKETTIREAIELHELAGGDENRVKGTNISQALVVLRGLRQRDEQAARERSERAQRAAQTRKKEQERQQERQKQAAERQQDAEAAAELEETKARLSQVFGEEWDASALSPVDVEALAGMVAGRPSPGLSRLRSAWDQATAEDREAFMLWVQGMEGGR